MPSDARSFAGVLRDLAASAEERVLYRFADDSGVVVDSLTAGQLDRRARAIAALLRESCAPGDRALLLQAPGLDFVASLFGAFYAGVIAVPVYPVEPARERRAPSPLGDVVRACSPAAVLTQRALAAGRGRWIEQVPELEGKPWLCADGVSAQSGERLQLPTVTPEDVALLQFTSGSTTAPRGVVLSHANLLHNSAAIQKAFGHGEESRGVIWLPPYHDMGLIGGILQPLYARFPVLLLSPLSFVRRPALWLELIGRERATTSGGPNFAYELCLRKVSPEEREKLDLRSWQLAFTGAEPVRADTLERFAEAFAPAGFRRSAFYPCYGLAESTLIVAGAARHDAPVVRVVDGAALRRGRAEPASEGGAAIPIVSCGRAVEGMRVVAVDSTGRTCADGVVGDLWVSGPSVAAGYWDRAAETEAAFGGRLLGDPDAHYLITGDLGFLWQGEVFVTGRAKELIIVGGRNYYPHDLEVSAVRCDPALRPAAAAFSIDLATREGVVLVLELGREADLERAREICAAVRAAIAGDHGLGVHEVVLAASGAIPRTQSGKTQRGLCRQKYLEGALAALARDSGDLEAAAPQPMAPAEAADRLRILSAVWCDVLGIASVRPDENFFDLGGTSLLASALLERISAVYRRPVRLVTLFQYPTVRALAAHLAGTSQGNQREQIAARVALQKAWRQRHARTAARERRDRVRASRRP